MGFIKLTDKEIGSKPVASTKFVVTQPENIDGVQKESVRRVGLTEIVNLVLSAGVAAEFSTSTAYSSGDYVVYQGELYRFKATHAAGDWNTAHVNKVVLMDEIQSALGTDKTLTEENVPADAKKVGDEISDLKDALSDFSVQIKTPDFTKLEWSKGNIDNSGKLINADTWIRTTKALYCPVGSVMTFTGAKKSASDVDYIVFIAEYDETKTFKQRRRLYTSPDYTDISLITENPYIRLLYGVAAASGATVDVSEGSLCTVSTVTPFNTVMNNAGKLNLLKRSSIVVTKSGLNSNLKLVPAKTRLSTCLIKIPGNITLTANNSYEFSIAVYNNDCSFRSYADSGNWLTSRTMTNTSFLYRLIIKRSSGLYIPIEVSEFENVFSNSFDGCEFVMSADDINVINDIQDNTNKTIIKTKLGFINFSISTQGFEMIPSIKRVCTPLISNPSQLTITANPGFLFSVVSYTPDFVVSSYDAQWVDTYTIAENNLFRLVVTRQDTSANLLASSASAEDFFSNSFDNCECFWLGEDTQMLAKIVNSYSDIKDDFNLNINLTTLHDMSWEYQNWVSPQCVSHFGIRNQLFFGFLTGDTPANYSGVAAYDYDTKQVTKTILKKNPVKDDHDLISVMVLSTGYVMVAYTIGHHEGNCIYVRVSTEKESIDRFGDYAIVPFEYSTSYTKLFEYNGKIYLFTRELLEFPDNWRWSYSISEDYGATWSDPVPFIVADCQYYLQMTETTTPGTLLVISYSNPTFDNTEIRASYLHLATMELYQTDNQTLIGTSSIDFHDINVMVSPATDKKIRMYEAAKSAVGDIKILFCEFTPVYNTNAGMYKVYDNGNTYNIVASGRDLIDRRRYAGGSGQLGIAWIGTDKIVLSRGQMNNYTDYLEIYSYDSSTGTSTLLETIDSVNHSNSIRIARPMVDVANHKAFVYWKGYYNKQNYVDFLADGRIHLLDDNS